MRALRHSRWRRPWRRVATIALVIGLGVLAGCGSGGKDDPLLRLSAQEALDQGKLLMADERYNQAREYLIHAFEVEPNSAAGREGLLLAADALFLAGGESRLIEAETRYRDFLNRFPTSDQAAYAQYQIGRALVGRMAKPNRDQDTTREALAAFEDLLRLYPTSPYASEARSDIEVVRAQLAEHEWVVGGFYYRYACGRRASRVCLAAAERFEGILEDYPEYPEKDKVLWGICRVYSKVPRPEDGVDACRLIQERYPDSEYASKAAKLKPKPTVAKEEADEQSSESGADDVADSGVR